MSRVKGAYNHYRPLRAMTDAEAAWVGAMIDAEGSVTRGHRGGWRVTFVNTEMEFIAAMLRVTGRGGVYLQRGNVWSWGIGAYHDVQQLCERIAPWCLKARRVTGNMPI